MWLYYGQNMVHLKSDIMKIAYYIWDQHHAMFKTSILPQEQQNDYSEYLLEWLLEEETHIAPMVVTLFAGLPLLETPFVL